MTSTNTHNMDDNLYDEFGNYIGPELGDSEDEDFDQEDHRFPDETYGYGGQMVVREENDNNMVVESDENRIVLHEDKKYYPDAAEVYPGVRTVTLDEDAQDLTEPIVKPIVIKNFSVLEKETPSLTYKTEFLVTLMNTPSLIRNVAIIGHLHHGKTLFLDTLVRTNQEKQWDPTKQVRYSDTRVDEQAREMSLKSTPVTLVMENFHSKSHLFNVIDCPGHVNFSDETSAILRVVDGVVLVVDCVEGVMLVTERVLRQAVREELAITVVRTPPFCFSMELMYVLHRLFRK